MMNLLKITPLLVAGFMPLAFAGQTLNTVGATQTQFCYSSLMQLKPSISALNSTTTIDTCLLLTKDPAKQVIISCPSSNNVDIDGIDKAKLKNDGLAVILFASCLAEIESSGTAFTSQDTAVLTQLTATKIASANPTADEKPTKTLNNTSNRWISSFELGYKQQNGYDDDGKRTGFDQGGITGSLKLNGRWRNSWGWSDAVTNFEVGVAFGQNPTVNEEKSDPDAAGFNDVTDTIDGYMKFLYSPGHIMATQNGDSVLSFAALAGIRSLDEATPGNELARYYGGGLEFNLYNQGVEKDNNALPRARIGGYFVRTSNHGAMTGVNLWVVQAQYQLVADKPFLLGFKANLGPDDLDDYSVTLSVRQDTAKLLSFFGFITE
ncbi:hypothetical protein JK628_22625 [Shewanella sp. KX20019]|uniref:hypothetical protein n=1 Tax=Shewanella sp. KX20019 TaxID=2803864 RepID=UPI0019256D9E|nr:hypothetical protein [Shewanella sp. KX20019]QQX80226.1 hypothetical protein JK628_22625 [Shewanella sp. KX20019]